jgi:hypothetical protein
VNDFVKDLDCYKKLQGTFLAVMPWCLILRCIDEHEVLILCYIIDEAQYIDGMVPSCPNNICWVPRVP